MDEDKVQNKTVPNSPPAGNLNKEVEPLSPFVESSEASPEISPEIGDYLKQSEPSVPDKDIIKASGENVPVNLGTGGKVILPTIDEAKKEAKKFSPREGKRWITEEVIREEIKKLKKAA